MPRIEISVCRQPRPQLGEPVVARCFAFRCAQHVPSARRITSITDEYTRARNSSTARPPACRRLRAHQPAGGIERRSRETGRPVALTDDLDLESAHRQPPAPPARSRARAMRQRGARTRRTSPSPRVCRRARWVRRRSHRRPSRPPRKPSSRSAPPLSFSSAAAARPMKCFLLEVHEPSEARLERTVDGPVFPRPCAEALFDAHGIERAPPEELQSMLAAGRHQKIVQRALIFRRHPDFEAEVAGEGHAAHIPRHHADFHAPKRHERERRARQVIAHQSLQQCARFRPCHRQTDVFHRTRPHRNARRRQMPLEPAQVVGFPQHRCRSGICDPARRGTW